MKDRVISRLQVLIHEVDEVENCDEFEDWREVALNSLQNIFPNKKKILDSIESIVAWEYQGLYEDGEDVSDDAVETAIKILNGLIKDVESGFGIASPPNTKKPQGTNHQIFQVNNQIHQLSQQTTQVDIDLQIKQQVDIRFKFIIDVFKDELNGKQLRELKEIQESNVSLEVKKQRFFEKVKSFGTDVAAGMLSNILANPDFIQQLFH